MFDSGQPDCVALKISRGRLQHLRADDENSVPKTGRLFADMTFHPNELGTAVRNRHALCRHRASSESARRGPRVSPARRSSPAARCWTRSIPKCAAPTSICSRDCWQGVPYPLIPGHVSVGRVSQLNGDGRRRRWSNRCVSARRSRFSTFTRRATTVGTAWSPRPRRAAPSARSTGSPTEPTMVCWAAGPNRFI